jgi:hypothetical protein
MKVFGQLERAQLQNVSADPTGSDLTPEGRIWYQTTSNRILTTDGTTLQTVLFGGIGQIVNADVNASAAIAYSKLNLASSILNADVAPAAAIAVNKLAAVTASRAVVSDASGFLEASSATATEVGYLSGVTSSIQSQISALSGLNSDGPASFNLGCRVQAGTFSIKSQSGANLSGSNPGYVFVPSNVTNGVIKRLAVTANHTFNDDNFAGTSDIVGEEFGVTSGIAWDQDRPFYIYACNMDDTDANLLFFISPNPKLVVSPDGVNIGYKGVPMATPSDNGAFFLTSTNVTATHNSKPCVRIGGIRMTMSASDDWTVGDITSGLNTCGITKTPWVGKIFTMPTGQNGAAACSYLFSNGPTRSSPATKIYNY